MDVTIDSHLSSVERALGRKLTQDEAEAMQLGLDRGDRGMIRFVTLCMIRYPRAVTMKIRRPEKAEETGR